MKKRKSKKQSARRELLNLTGKLYGYGDSYMRAVAEVVTYARDGSSDKRLEMVKQALQFKEDATKMLELVKGINQ